MIYLAYRNLFLKTSVAVSLLPEKVPPLAMLHFAAETNVAGEENHTNAHEEVDVKSCRGGVIQTA
jgi:hypothetical protein